MIALDFETYYTATYSVREMGALLYCRDPRFKCTMVAAHSPHVKVSCRPEHFPWPQLHGKQIIAHNAGFDKAVFERLKADGVVPEDIEPAGWLDTAALAAFLGLPRDLAGAVKAMFDVTLDKSIRDRMQGVQADLFDDVSAYAASDAEWAWKLWDRLSYRWPAGEAAICDLTRRMGEGGLALDAAAAKAAEAKLAAEIAGLEAALPFSPPASMPALRQACQAAGQPVPPGTAAKDPKVEAWCAENQAAESPLWVRQVQAWRKANRTREVIRAMLDRIHPETGRMQYELKYFGAGQTGRWSGGGGLNIQNFNRQAGAQGVDLRGLIVPAPGSAFVIADYAQIEARVLLWLAGDYAFLDDLRGGMDLYEAAARRMLGYDDPRPLKAVNPGLRQLAKGMTLGLGFGMGAGKFVSAAKILAGLDLSFEDCREHVATFRRANQKIVDFWRRNGDAFESRHAKPFYRAMLPSGRAIHYWEPLCEGDMTYAPAKGGPRVSAHAGLLAENIVQATARDILADAWLRCDEAGVRIVASIHDELVAECPAKDAEAVRERMAEIMQTPPAWPLSDRLPLAVEARVANRYGK